MIAFLTGVWPLLSHVTEGTVLIGALVTAAVMSPVLKREFAYAAAAVALCMFVYALGVRDEKHHRDAREAAAQAAVEDAVHRADGKGKDRWDDPRN